MHLCKTCNYLTSTYNNLKIHYKSKKHFEQVIQYNKISINGPYYCEYCNKEYTHKSSLYRHRKICLNININNKLKKDIEKQHIQLNNFDLIKIEHQLEIEKLKHELDRKDLDKKDLEKKLELSMLENKHLHTQNNTVNNTVNNNNTIINNVKISKIQYLNLNFGNVIDISTFIENYKNKYGLTTEQALTLLENYQNDGINGCISTLVYYLKQSAIKQYKELKGQDINMHDIILPFILSDKSLREHFEKSNNGKWDKTTMVENIKKIIIITNNQVYNHHNKFMNFNAAQRKRIINGVLKASGFSILSQISIPDFYKVDLQSIAIKDTDSNSNTPCLEEKNNTNCITDVNIEENGEEDDDEEDDEEDDDDDDDEEEDDDDEEEDDE